MRLLSACAGTLLLVVLGGQALKGMADLVVFDDHPLVVKVSETAATVEDVLTLQEPKSITLYLSTAVECFDYVLESRGKKVDFYVVFTLKGHKQSSGYSTCSQVNGSNAGVSVFNEAAQ